MRLVRRLPPVLLITSLALPALGAAPTRAEVVKGIIVRQLQMFPAIDHSPDRAENHERFFENIESLLALLDAEDKGAAKVLVSLSSYYLGDWTRQVYACVLVRKGRKAMKEIDAGLTAPNECLGREKRDVTCYSDQGARDQLVAIKRRILAGETCVLADLQAARPSHACRSPTPGPPPRCRAPLSFPAPFGNRLAEGSALRAGNARGSAVRRLVPKSADVGEGLENTSPLVERSVRRARETGASDRMKEALRTG